MQTPHDRDEYPGCEKSYDTREAIDRLRAPAPKLRRAIARKRVIKTEQGYHSKKRPKVEGEQAHDGSEDDDQVGV